MTKKKHDLGHIISGAIGVLFFVIAVTIFVLTRHIIQTYGVDFGALLYTLVSPLKGTGGNTVAKGVRDCLPQILKFLAAVGVAAFLPYQRSVSIYIDVKGSRRIDLLRWGRWAFILLGLVSVFLSFRFCDQTLGIRAWLAKQSEQTSIYEDHYIDPLAVSISGGHKNLIHIYIESMETTYASKDVGGAQEVNYIPNLTSLALSEGNTSFSDNGALGGFSATGGSSWTMGALFTATSGLPFMFPIEGNSMGMHERFASGVTSLGDILEREGYTQEFLCGSDASFAGRKDYFEQHGNYEIFDYTTAVQQGYIEADHYVWWGYEDYILYEIAKDEALRLADTGKPFNLTFLTVDQHHIGGYICPKCGDEYDIPLGNVLACGDRLVKDFIDWCKEQDFYEDTVIVITGDHPRMDTILVEGVESADRQVYNCFINADKEPAQATKYRTFTTVDIFPTVLSAMGFEIEGDRLGLGTDLFSSLPTLAEEMGIDTYRAELDKSSLYYIRTFS